MPEVRLIDANTLKDKISNTKLRVKSHEMLAGFVEMKAAALREIENAQTVEAEPVRHGRWILRSVQPDKYNNNFYECSICRATEKHNINVNVPYCWHCGAKMGDSEVETDTVARWEDAGINGTVKCSRCQFTDFFAKRDRVMLFQYCPGCGAKMDGGTDDA